MTTESINGWCSQCEQWRELRVIFSHARSRQLCQECTGAAWDIKPGDDVANAYKLRTAKEVDAVIDEINRNMEKP